MSTKDHKENDRRIIIDISPHSGDNVCPKCCSLFTDHLSAWEAAELGVAVNKTNRCAKFYRCGDCGTVWHDE